MFLPKRWKWDRSIPEDDRRTIVDQILRLPAWVDGQLGAQNLDVRKLESRDGLWRLRIGDYRAVFQPLGADVVLHHVFRRKADGDYSTADKITVVPSSTGLRTVATEPPARRPAVPPTRHPVVRPARRDPVQNPVSVFSDAELRTIGLGDWAIDELRRIPPELLPDRALVRLGVDAEVIRFVAELWERPENYRREGARWRADRAEEQEAAERLASKYSATSLVAIDDARAFLALLDADIEDWMVYLHPSQLERCSVQSLGPHVFEAALAPARRLSRSTGRDTWPTRRAARSCSRPSSTHCRRSGSTSGLVPGTRARSCDCRTVNQLAYELYESGGGTPRDRGRVSAEGVDPRDLGEAAAIGSAASARSGSRRSSTT